MPSFDIPNIKDNPSEKDITTYLIRLQREMTWLLQNLDDMNVTHLTAKSIKVESLSAISANLGHIIAGIIESVEIYGAKIATSKDSYPRAEMSETDKLFRVMLSPDVYAEFMAASSLGGGVPALRFVSPDGVMTLGEGAASSLGMGINSTGVLVLGGSNGIQVVKAEVYGWNNFRNNQSGRTLQQEINDLTSSINALTSALNGKANSGASTGSAGSANGGIAPGTQLRTSDGGTVTWMGIPSHSHSQS